jgi:hypothetical protein
MTHCFCRRILRCYFGLIRAWCSFAVLAASGQQSSPGVDASSSSDAKLGLNRSRRCGTTTRTKIVQAQSLQGGWVGGPGRKDSGGRAKNERELPHKAQLAQLNCRHRQRVYVNLGKTIDATASVMESRHVNAADSVRNPTFNPLEPRRCARPAPSRALSGLTGWGLFSCSEPTSPLRCPDLYRPVLRVVCTGCACKAQLAARAPVQDGWDFAP